MTKGEQNNGKDFQPERNGNEGSGMNYSGRKMHLKDFRSYFDCTIEFETGLRSPMPTTTASGSAISGARRTCGRCSLRSGRLRKSAGGTC